MVTRDNDRAATPSDTARAQLLRRTLFTNTIRAQSLLLSAAYAAKEARRGPLLKAIAAPDGVELTGSVRSRVEVIGGQSRTARATSDLLWSARTTLSAAYTPGAVRIGSEIVDARGLGGEANSSAGSGKIDALELSPALAAIDLGDGSVRASAANSMAIV